MPRRRELRELAADPQLGGVLRAHGRRGLRVQVVVRVVLVLFTAGTALFVAPARYQDALYVAVLGYAVLALAANGWLLTGRDSAVRYGWSTLFIDVAALGVLTLIAGQAAVQSWTADLIINGFFVVPLLAATQLRPGVCLAVVLPTDAAYLAASLATEQANTEPLASVLLRAVALLALSAGCVALSAIQRSRVLTIGSLVASRARLLSDLVDLESRERQRLSEHLHDGALQYVLAARMDLDDLRDGTDPAALERIDTALGQTSALLRSTVGELYPAVLEQAGLPDALRQIAGAAADRGGFTVSVDDDGWPGGARTSADRLLFTAARELLANVVKHSGAHTVAVSVALTDGTARVIVRDDGSGIPEGELDRKLRGGHIGVASHRARIDAAGGALTFGPAPGGGTVVTVSLPVTPVPA